MIELIIGNKYYEELSCLYSTLATLVKILTHAYLLVLGRQKRNNFRWKLILTASEI